MNKIFCITAFITNSFSAAAQCDQQEPSDSVLYKKLNQSFSNLATGRGDAITLTNYGSFEPVNGQFKLNVFTPLGPVQKKKAFFLSFFAGGTLIGENTSILFSNSKFSAGMNAGIKLHLPPVKLENHFLSSNGKKILDQICSEYKKYTLDSSYAIFDYDSSYIAIRLQQGKLRMDALLRWLAINEKLRDALTDSLNKINAIDTSNRLRIANQLLDVYKQLRQITADTTDLNSQIRKDKRLIDSALLRENAASKILDVAKKEYLQKKDSLEMTLDTKGAKASWFSFVGDIGRRKHYLFHDSLPFGQQLEEKKFTTSSWGIEFNFVGYSDKDKNVFVGPLPNFHAGNIGLIRICNNDIDDYSTVELSDAIKYVAGDSTHNVSSKYQVYIDSISKYSAWKFYGNYYRTFGKDQRFAWHIFADAEFRSNNRNPVNAGAGLLFAFKNKKDNNVLNIEFYGKLSDIGKALPTEESSFINRNEIGIHIGIPINIPTFK